MFRDAPWSFKEVHLGHDTGSVININYDYKSKPKMNHSFSRI